MNINLVEEAQNLATSVLSTGLLVVNNTRAGGQNNVAELTRWQQVDDLLLDIRYSQVETWADNTALVDASDQVDDDLSAPVVINDFELSDVSCRMPTAYGWRQGERRATTEKLRPESKIIHAANPLTMLLHNFQELHDDLAGRADEDLPLTALLGIVHCLEGISQNAHAHHF